MRAGETIRSQASGALNFFSIAEINIFFWQPESMRAIDAAVAAGVTLIDTAWCDRSIVHFEIQHDLRDTEQSWT